MVREYKLATVVENASVQVCELVCAARVYLQASIEACSAQDVWNALWDDSDVWKAYHTDSDHEDVSVSPWLNNERRVVFSTPLKAPAFIKKIVGQKVTVCTAFTWLLSCMQPVVQHRTLQTCN